MDAIPDAQLNRDIHETKSETEADRDLHFFKVQDQDDTGLWKQHLKTETLATKITSLIFSIDLLKKFSYFTRLLLKINKATSQYCFIQSLLSADNF